VTEWERNRYMRSV